MLKCTNVTCTHSVDIIGLYIFAQTAADPKKEILTTGENVVVTCCNMWCSFAFVFYISFVHFVFVSVSAIIRAVLNLCKIHCIYFVNSHVSYFVSRIQPSPFEHATVFNLEYIFSPS